MPDKELCVDNRTDSLIALTIHCLMGMQSFEVNSGGQDVHEAVKTGKKKVCLKDRFLFFSPPIIIFMTQPHTYQLELSVI